MNLIEKQRLKDFEYNYVHGTELSARMNIEFETLNWNIPTNQGSWLVLLLFEYLLFNNYIASNMERVVTKCDISTRIIASNSEYRGAASSLLNTVYELRNAVAHNKLISQQLYMKFLKVIKSIKSIQTLQSILRLIMPVEYPACLNNIYYLVKRDIDNPNYIKLKGDMFTELKLPNKTVKQVLDKFNSEVNESIRNQALLEVLGNYGLTDKEKQET